MRRPVSGKVRWTTYEYMVTMVMHRAFLAWTGTVAASYCIMECVVPSVPEVTFNMNADEEGTIIQVNIGSCDLDTS